MIRSFIGNVGMARILDGTTIDTSEMNEVYLDTHTGEIKSKAQEREIRRLEVELEDKKKKRRKSIESIIGYFYKER